MTKEIEVDEVFQKIAGEEKVVSEQGGSAL